MLHYIGRHPPDLRCVPRRVELHALAGRSTSHVAVRMGPKEFPVKYVGPFKGPQELV